jgi:aspartate carbamoyltransferase catalytic subunit
MRHLTDIETLSKQEILDITDLAKKFKEKNAKSEVEGKTLALMFYENSTRTRCSFEIAGKKLGMNVINFEAKSSSLAKGESLKDTIENLYHLGVDAVVIRHNLSGIVENTKAQVKYPISFINAGDGSHAHPSQALLDFYTMIEKTGSVEGKKVAIIGDIKHSRVTRSNIALLTKFGADIHLCAPSYLAFENTDCFKATVHKDVKSAVKDAEIVMLLRVQNERLEYDVFPDSFEYKRMYEVDSKLLKEYASPKVILMHPGPANRNIEVSSELLDDKIGRTILEQAQNGVFVRMAILNLLLKGSEGSYAS